MCACVCVCVCQRDKQTDRDRYRNREREREKERHRQAERKEREKKFFQLFQILFLIRFNGLIQLREIRHLILAGAVREDVCFMGR